MIEFGRDEGRLVGELLSGGVDNSNNIRRLSALSARYYGRALARAPTRLVAKTLQLCGSGAASAPPSAWPPTARRNFHFALTDLFVHALDQILFYIL